MKKSILTLIAFALTILTASADSTNKQHGSIKIVAETRPEINYATHLYTLAELGFKDDEYSAKYIGTVAKADLDTLRKYNSLLSFGTVRRPRITARAVCLPECSSLRLEARRFQTQKPFRT